MPSQGPSKRLSAVLLAASREFVHGFSGLGKETYVQGFLGFDGVLLFF